MKKIVGIVAIFALLIMAGCAGSARAATEVNTSTVASAGVTNAKENAVTVKAGVSDATAADGQEADCNETADSDATVAGVVLEDDSSDKNYVFVEKITDNFENEDKFGGEIKDYYAIINHASYDSEGSLKYIKRFEYLYDGQIVVTYTDNVLFPDWSYKDEELLDDKGRRIGFCQSGEVGLTYYTEIEYDEYDNVLRRYYKEATKDLSYRHEFLKEYKYGYDFKGNIVAEVSVDPDGSDIIEWEYENTYDEAGRLLEVAFVQFGEYRVSTNHYYYYEDGAHRDEIHHIITTREDDPDYRRIINYDYNGRILADYEYKVDDEDVEIFASRSGYSLAYNEAGKVTEEKCYTYNGPSYLIVYEYDSNNLLTKAITYDSDNSVYGYETWEYEKIPLVVSPNNDYDIGNHYQRFTM